MAHPKKSGFRGRRPRINIPLNEHIRAKRLQVIDHEGTSLGELSKDEALAIAKDAGLDLYVVSDKGNVPIAKIVDYGKYKFEQSKKDKGQKKKQSGNDTKEIKMGYNIDVGDYNTRVNRSKEFLDKGKRVKLNITLRGREIQHSALAKELALRFIEDVMEHGTADSIPEKMTGRSVIVYIIPGADKQRIKKKKEEEKKRLELEEEANDAKDTTQLQNS